jgi:hypothetical protein
MTVSTDGSVSELSLASEPKSTEAEQAANDAFNQVQPLPALPSGANGAKLTLKFDSQASQHATNSNLTTQLDPIVSKSPAASTGDSTQATDNK